MAKTFKQYRVFKWQASTTDLSALITTICSEGWEFIQANGDMYIFCREKEVGSSG